MAPTIDMSKVFPEKEVIREGDSGEVIVDDDWDDDEDEEDDEDQFG